MLCDRCKKIISQFEKDYQKGKETVESLINCKECSKEIVNRCHTCYGPIYEKELVYESSHDISLKENFVFGIIRRIFGISNPEKIIQCDWCLEQGETELKEKEKSLRGREGIIGSLSFLMIISTFLFFYPKWIERILKEGEGFKKCSHPYSVIASFSLLFGIISGLIIVCVAAKIPKVNRYEVRKYRNKKENKEIKLKTPQENPKV